MKEESPLRSPIHLAHHFWQLHLRSCDHAIDATCGGGHDTLFLARICKVVLSLDIQEEALDRAKNLMNIQRVENVQFIHSDHEILPPAPFPIHLIVYNLGYLPGGDKQITTRVSSTLKSVEEATRRVGAGGMVSITCYPGHPEGAREAQALLLFCKNLDKQTFSVSEHGWLNRKRAPFLILIQKNSDKFFL